MANLSGDEFRVLEDVGGGISQDPVIGAGEGVLAAIVFDQPLPVVRAVVLDHEAGGGVIEVRSAERELDLHLRRWQTGLNEQPSQASLHLRFGRLGELVESTKAPPQSRIRQDEILDTGKLPAETGEGPRQSGGRETADHAPV